MKINEWFISGENCDEQLFSRNVQEKEEGGYGHIVAVVFAAIIVVGISLTGWMYHRRRVADLKSEIAQVQYIAEPVPPPGKLLYFYLRVLRLNFIYQRFFKVRREKLKFSLSQSKYEVFLFIVERNQFDNPVYAYQGSSKFDDGTTTLLNNFQFRNNLHKNINTEKAKFGLGSCTDEEDDCKGIARLLTIK